VEPSCKLVRWKKRRGTKNTCNTRHEVCGETCMDLKNSMESGEGSRLDLDSGVGEPKGEDG